MSDDAPVGLTLGAFACNATIGRCQVTVMANGADLTGNVDPIESVITTLMRLGSLVVTEGFPNVTLQVPLRILGPDELAIDAVVALLHAELYRINVLTYEGPLLGEPTCWDVVTSKPVRTQDDVAEAIGKRFYTIQLTCKPFRRKSVQEVVPALGTSGSTTVSVNDGSSTTGWTGTDNGSAVTPTVSSGAILVESLSTAETTELRAILTTSISTVSTKYLVIDWRTVNAQAVPVAVYGDNTLLPTVATQVLPSGFTRTTVYVTADSVGVLQIAAITTDDLYGNIAGKGILVDQVSRSDVQPSIGTARQLLRAWDVLGSAPTEASIAVEHETDALGEVVVYTYLDQPGVPYVPAMSAHRTTGRTPDAARVSGATDNLDTLRTFDVPMQALPRGRYVMASLLNGTATFTGAINWSTQTRINSTNIGALASGTAVNLDLTTQARLYPLAWLSLPLLDVGDASAAVLRVTLQDAVVDTSDIVFDELYFFNTTIGQLVHVSCGTATAVSGGPSNRLFIEPPSLTSPRKRLRRGHAANGSDSFHAMSGTDGESWQQPLLNGGKRVQVFTVTSNALNAAVTASYYQRQGG